MPTLSENILIAMKYLNYSTKGIINRPIALNKNENIKRPVILILSVRNPNKNPMITPANIVKLDSSSTKALDSMIPS